MFQFCVVTLFSVTGGRPEPLLFSPPLCLPGLCCVYFFNFFFALKICWWPYSLHFVLVFYISMLLCVCCLKPRVCYFLSYERSLCSVPHPHTGRIAGAHTRACDSAVYTLPRPFAKWYKHDARGSSMHFFSLSAPTSTEGGKKPIRGKTN